MAHELDAILPLFPDYNKVQFAILCKKVIYGIVGNAFSVANYFKVGVNLRYFARY